MTDSAIRPTPKSSLSVLGIKLGMSRREVVQSLGSPTEVKGPWTRYRGVLVKYENEMTVIVMGRQLENNGASISIGSDNLLNKNGILIQYWKDFLIDDCQLGPPTYFGFDNSIYSKYHHGARYEDLQLTITERNYCLQAILESRSSLTTTLLDPKYSEVGVPSENGL